MRVSLTWNGISARAAAVAVDAPDLAAGPEDYGLAVRRPVHVRIDAVDRPGLLHVVVEIGIDLPLLARAQVLDVERGLRPPVAVDVSEPAAVGRRRRADRAAGAAGDLGALAGGDVVALDREHLLVRILGIFEGVAGGGVAAEIDGPAVGRESGLAQFLLELGLGRSTRGTPSPTPLTW